MTYRIPIYIVTLSDLAYQMTRLWIKVKADTDKIPERRTVPACKTGISSPVLRYTARSGFT